MRVGEKPKGCLQVRCCGFDERQAVRTKPAMQKLLKFGETLNGNPEQSPEAPPGRCRG
jgi:hypothetical protein